MAPAYQTGWKTAPFIYVLLTTPFKHNLNFWLELRLENIMNYKFFSYATLTPKRDLHRGIASKRSYLNPLRMNHKTAIYTKEYITPSFEKIREETVRNEQEISDMRVQFIFHTSGRAHIVTWQRVSASVPTWYLVLKRFYIIVTSFLHLSKMLTV